ncbi:Hypothetical_protein [Hexamita inflata]|uniref:Hypothetical_protein n=1 Tax=Hexamita inflata TaxID=28002 RepID=A0AA86QL06_9EUKA|nr:Hypothetical protein HINF_LOCUS49146 [Hexamita inflata]
MVSVEQIIRLIHRTARLKTMTTSKLSIFFQRLPGLGWVRRRFSHERVRPSDNFLPEPDLGRVPEHPVQQLDQLSDLILLKGCEFIVNSVLKYFKYVFLITLSVQELSHLGRQIKYNQTGVSLL